MNAEQKQTDNGETYTGEAAAPLLPEGAGEPAFPEAQAAEPGLSAREYACIQLKVPDSGTDWLDELIVKARKMDMLAQIQLEESKDAKEALPRDGGRGLAMFFSSIARLAAGDLGAFDANAAVGDQYIEQVKAAFNEQRASAAN